eukprot:g27320.t1
MEPSWNRSPYSTLVVERSISLLTALTSDSNILVLPYDTSSSAPSPRERSPTRPSFSCGVGQASSSPRHPQRAGLLKAATIGGPPVRDQLELSSGQFLLESELVMALLTSASPQPPERSSWHKFERYGLSTKNMNNNLNNSEIFQQNHHGMNGVGSVGSKPIDPAVQRAYGETSTTEAEERRGVQQGILSAEDSKSETVLELRTRFHLALAQLFFAQPLERQYKHWQGFMSRVRGLSQALALSLLQLSQQAKDSAHSNEADKRRPVELYVALIVADLLGVAKACRNQTSYSLLFDWLNHAVPYPHPTSTSLQTTCSIFDLLEHVWRLVILPSCSTIPLHAAAQPQHNVRPAHVLAAQSQRVLHVRNHLLELWAELCDNRHGRCVQPLSPVHPYMRSWHVHGPPRCPAQSLCLFRRAATSLGLALQQVVGVLSSSGPPHPQAAFRGAGPAGATSDDSLSADTDPAIAELCRHPASLSLARMSEAHLLHHVVLPLASSLTALAKLIMDGTSLNLGVVVFYRDSALSALQLGLRAVSELGASRQGLSLLCGYPELLRATRLFLAQLLSAAQDTEHSWRYETQACALEWFQRLILTQPAPAGAGFLSALVYCLESANARLTAMSAPSTQSSSSPFSTPSGHDFTDVSLGRLHPLHHGVFCHLLQCVFAVSPSPSLASSPDSAGSIVLTGVMDGSDGTGGAASPLRLRVDQTLFSPAQQLVQASQPGELQQVFREYLLRQRKGYLTLLLSLFRLCLCDAALFAPSASPSPLEPQRLEAWFAACIQCLLLVAVKTSRSPSHTEQMLDSLAVQLQATLPSTEFLQRLPIEVLSTRKEEADSSPLRTRPVAPAHKGKHGNKSSAKGDRNGAQENLAGGTNNNKNKGLRADLSRLVHAAMTHRAGLWSGMLDSYGRNTQTGRNPSCQLVRGRFGVQLLPVLAPLPSLPQHTYDSAGSTTDATDEEREEEEEEEQSRSGRESGCGGNKAFLDTLTQFLKDHRGVS